MINQFDPIQITVGDFYDASNGQAVETLSSGRLGQSIELPITPELAQKLPELSVVRTKITV